MKSGIFITGTDTGVGKTLVSALIVSAWKAHGIKPGYFKPLQSGSDSDTASVASFAGLAPENFPRPTYLFKEPVAPYRATLLGGEAVQLDQIFKHWKELDDRAWVVEGCGGLLCPLSAQHTIRDLIEAMELPVILVASTRLGTMNHTLLSIEAARARGLHLAGIVLVGQEDPGLDRILMDLSSVPVIAQIPWLENLTPQAVQEAGPKYFPVSVLKSLFNF